MSEIYVDELQRMARELIKREHKGPGDTIEGAAERLQRQYRRYEIKAVTLIRLWNRKITDAKMSTFFTVFKVYQDVVAKYDDAAENMDRAYEREREISTIDTNLLRLVDFVVSAEANAKAKTKAGRRTNP